MKQKMTVQHVHVAEGGQAIVGNVSAPAPGGGATEKSGEQPHALSYFHTTAVRTPQWFQWLFSGYLWRRTLRAGLESSGESSPTRLPVTGLRGDACDLLATYKSP